MKHVTAVRVIGKGVAEFTTSNGWIQLLLEHAPWSMRLRHEYDQPMPTSFAFTTGIHTGLYHCTMRTGNQHPLGMWGRSDAPLFW